MGRKESLETILIYQNTQAIRIKYFVLKFDKSTYAEKQFCGCVHKPGSHAQKKGKCWLDSSTEKQTRVRKYFLLSLVSIKGGGAFLIYFFNQTISHQVPFVFLLDILEYFQVDGSITSMPLVKVLSHPVCIFMYHVNFPHNTSFLLSEDLKISPSLSLPSK